MAYCTSCWRIKQREYGRRAYDEALAAYGGKCTCCGESERSFLVLHHVDGQGKVDGKGGQVEARRLREAGWPPHVQLLCANCHTSLHRLGSCACALTPPPSAA